MLNAFASQALDAWRFRVRAKIAMQGLLNVETPRSGHVERSVLQCTQWAIFTGAHAAATLDG